MKLYTVHVKWQKRVTAFLLMISIVTGIIACNPLQTEAGVYIHDLYDVKDFDLSIYRADNYLKNDSLPNLLMKSTMGFSYPSQTLSDDASAKYEIVLVLDKSGSMEGESLEQTKQAAKKFAETVMKEDARIAVVSYSDYGCIDCNFTRDQDAVDVSIDAIEDEDNTNIYDGLSYAEDILDESDAEKKIIVLMTDGLPNEGNMITGSYQDVLIDYADRLKEKEYYLYTLGFFSSLAQEELAGAQQMLGRMASPGYHYEVEDADNLVFFFDDIAGQIKGTKYVYIRIACPVDVSVKCDGEELSSAAETENTRTSFGTLTYENIEEKEDEDETEAVEREDRVKILRLNMDKEYDIDIAGYGDGTMDYSVSYPDENGEYTDVRDFPGIKVTSKMKATSNTGQSDASILKVDENGDGKFEKNTRQKLMEQWKK